MVATITPHALADLRRRGEHVPLIDVRTPAEFGEVHVVDARNVPLDRIDPRALAAEAAPEPSTSSASPGAAAAWPARRCSPPASPTW